MRLSPVLTGLRTYPFVRLTEARRRLLGGRRAGDRLRHRRAARGDAGVHPRGAGAVDRPAVALPAGRGAAGAAGGDRGVGGRRFGVALDPDTEVVPTLGSKEAVFHLAQVLDGDVVVVPQPAYPVYERGAVFAGKQVVELPLRGGRRLPARPRRRSAPTCGGGPAILWLNYPNNPTAATAPLGALRAGGGARPRARLRGRLRRGVLGAVLRRRAAGVGAAGRRPHERGGVQHAVQALVDAGLPLGLRGRRPRAGRGAEALPAERRRRAAGVRPARRGRGVGRRGARRGGARRLPRQARRAGAGAGGARSAPRGRRRDVLPVARGRARPGSRSGCSSAA